MNTHEKCYHIPWFPGKESHLKKLIHRTKRKKIHITADTAHLLNRMAVCACACFSIEHLECVHDFKYECICECMPVCMPVCVCVLPKSRNGQPHSSESLNRWHRDQRSGSVQTSYWLVTAWTRPLHFPACCWSRWTPRCGLGQQKMSDVWKMTHTQKKNPEVIIPTQEPGRFLPTESCALVVHSLQASVCTAEHHGPLGFPGWDTL